MPFYQVSHAFPLSPAQQDALGEAITAIHLSIFPLVPKFFVTVAFADTTQQVTYIAGKRSPVNMLVGQVRHGSRTVADFEDLRDQLEAAWERIVVAPARASRGEEEGARYRLHRLIIHPANPIGKEAGIELPLAGQEQAWMDKHWVEFKKRAEAGDENFTDLVKSVEAKTNGAH